MPGYSLPTQDCHLQWAWASSLTSFTFIRFFSLQTAFIADLHQRKPAETNLYFLFLSPTCTATWALLGVGWPCRHHTPAPPMLPSCYGISLGWGFRMKLDFPGDVSIKKIKRKKLKGEKWGKPSFASAGWTLHCCPWSPCELQVHFTIAHRDGALSWVLQDVAAARGPQEGSRREDAPRAQGGAACIDFHSIYWSNWVCQWNARQAQSAVILRHSCHYCQ